MIKTLEIGINPKFDDPIGRRLKYKIKSYFGLLLESIRLIRLISFDTKLSNEELEEIRTKIFTNPVTEISAFKSNTSKILPNFDLALWVGLKPGVRDNEGATALDIISDTLKRKINKTKETIYCSRLYLIKAPKINHKHGEIICSELLANSIIQFWKVYPNYNWKNDKQIKIIIPKITINKKPKIENFSIPNNDTLISISDKRHLFLNPNDLSTIRNYFDNIDVHKLRKTIGLSNNPTDVELEYISQARSDHCNHNTFNGRFFYQNLISGETTEIDNLFKQCIKKPTEFLANIFNWIISTLWDNAGIARLTNEYNYAITVETHNSPSNIEAYGGAITGIVGVYRDLMGTGLGTKLVAGLWGFCTAPNDYTGNLNPALKPRRLLDGIIEGVRDGGNKSGVPTISGVLNFDQRYLGKCLVFVGAIGIIPHNINNKPSHLKKIIPGDVIFMCGGRVGADGIHGATASSSIYTKNTPISHVQIGDPYTQKKLHDFLLEARNEGLIRFITDIGGGGLSSSIGESCRYSSGAEVDLKLVPLKYNGLDPWQIWISESQERMTVAVDPNNTKKFLTLANKHAVEATIIGHYTENGKLKIVYGNKICAYIDIELLDDNFPQWIFSALWSPPQTRNNIEPVLKETSNFEKILLDILKTPNLCSRAWIHRQYDHEVQGTSLIKPLIGRHRDMPSEATAILPILNSNTGLAIAQVLLTEYSDIDTYYMATASVEEAYRRIVAIGGNPDQVAGVDNFCWPSINYNLINNPDGYYKAAQLVRACWGLRDACLSLGIPLLSGKDSMYIDGSLSDQYNLIHKISGPPTMMFTATVPILNLKSLITMEPKIKNDLVYILGSTKNELGGSALYSLLKYPGLNIPKTIFIESIKICTTLSIAQKANIIASACIISKGGLAYTLARMVISSKLGLNINLDKLSTLSKLSTLPTLFSETTGRFIVTINPNYAQEFESLLDDIFWLRLGTVTSKKNLIITANNESTIINIKWLDMYKAFTQRFGDMI